MDEKEKAMLFVQIVVSLILAIMLCAVYWALFADANPPEIQQNQAIVIIGKLAIINQFGSTPGQAQIESFGRHKLALLEEALPDINGRLVDKKA